MDTRSQLPGLNPAEREQVQAAPAPSHARLMKAVLSREAFSDPDWLFERKLDGIRCLAVRDGDAPRMLSRNDLDLGGRYPEVRDALSEQSRQRFAVDGEIVAFDRGQTSFARLAQRGHHPVAVFYYVFDLLWLDGFDVRALALRTRKRLLRDTVTTGGRLRLSTHRNGSGEAMFDHACRQGWEGVVAKRADAPYREKRSRDWLKFKCEAGQELVIGGFTAPRGSRTELGALLLGYYDDGQLAYAGKVGTGFDRETLEDLGRRLGPCGATAPRSWRRTRSEMQGSRGSSRGSSPRWPSPSGRTPGGCVTRVTSGCARTSRPIRWSVNHE